MNNPVHELRAEALQKIGRNIVHFQRFEGLLKAILAKSQVEGRTFDSITELRSAMASIDFGNDHTPQCEAGGPGGGRSRE